MRENDTLFTSRTAFVLSYIPAPCDHGRLVTDEEKLQYLKNKVCILTGSSTTNAFPISQPESFKRSTIPSIMGGKYCASLKTDGIRAMLLLTKYKDEFVAVLIDRKMIIREVEVWAHEKYFDDTLFDGEIVTEESKNVCRSDVFLVFDMYVDQGVSMILDEYSTRITAFNKAILETTETSNIEDAILEMHKVYIPEMVGLKLRPKCILKSSETTAVWKRRKDTPHRNDGIIFTPDNSIFTTKVYKWKPVHTIDVLIYKGSRVPYVMYSRQLTPSPTLVIDKKQYKLHDVRTNVLVESHFSKMNENSVILECTCDIDNDTKYITLTPIRIRDDKTTPNAFYVVKETINNVLENVTINEFGVKRMKK